MDTTAGLVRDSTFRDAVEAIACARELGPSLQEFSTKADELRRVPHETMDAIRASGLFDLMTPRKFGGSELGIGALIATGSTLAEYCASTAWVYEVLAGHNWLLSLLPQEGQREVFESVNPLTASCTRAVGDIRRVAEGVSLGNVKGRFCSGIDHAGWIALSAAVQSGQSRDQCFVIVPAESVQILDDWHTSGMRGTGSKSFTIRELFVPDSRVLPIKRIVAGNAPGLETNTAAIYRAPFPQILPFQLAGVPLGLARAALSTFIEIKKAAMAEVSPSELGEYTATYLLISESATNIDAAHALIENDCKLIDETGEPDSLTPVNRVKYVRDVAYAVQMARVAVNKLYEASGGSGIYDTHPMQRLWRDMNAAASHAAFSLERGSTMYARALLDLPPSPRYQIGQ